MPVSISKIAYTLLKTGDDAEARDEFEAAMKLNPKDETAALEFAFLKLSRPRSRFRRDACLTALRKSANAQTRATAEQAFQNIDQPLADGIARWNRLCNAATSQMTFPCSVHTGNWLNLPSCATNFRWPLKSLRSVTS